MFPVFQRIAAAGLLVEAPLLAARSGRHHMMAFLAVPQRAPVQIYVRARLGNTMDAVEHAPQPPDMLEHRNAKHEIVLIIRKIEVGGIHAQKARALVRPRLECGIVIDRRDVAGAQARQARTTLPSRSPPISSTRLPAKPTSSRSHSSFSSRPGRRPRPTTFRNVSSRRRSLNRSNQALTAAMIRLAPAGRWK